jgi:hypothetical protein
MRQEMGTSRIVDDNNGCNEMEDTVPVSLYSLPDHALPTRPNEEDEEEESSSLL